MENMTVSEVSRAFNVSTRMLRYYEQAGLIESLHIENYAYRIYDENAVRRLQQIIILRKLRIPLKQIAIILGNDEQKKSLELILDNITELNDEISSLVTIRNILSTIASRIEDSIGSKIRFDLIQDKELTDVINVLSFQKNNLKEERSMNDLNTANEVLNRKLNIRLVLLPPCTVASYHYIGENPEEKVGDVMDKFIRESRLYNLKPDSRLFGFNNPEPSDSDKPYGYEDWVTIPDDMDLPAPLTKKKFEGGLYAALTIDFPNFHEWGDLINWAWNNDQYIPDYDENGKDTIRTNLEEHLNWVYSSHMGWPENGIDGKVDLLIPIKKK